MTIYEHIAHNKQAGKKMLAVLLDPAPVRGERAMSLEPLAMSTQPDFIFVGGSGYEEHIDGFVRDLKAQTEVPIVLFPGSPEQVTPEADALLFLSLLSGRNPEMLIGSQVRAARKVVESGIETIPMGYILIDGGKTSSVEKASGTRALPAADVETIVDTALAGELLGMKTVYLEAGSGAKNPVAIETIKRVRGAISVPLIVGGGICKVEQMQTAFAAGADIVVIGNHFEQHPEEIPLFAAAKGQRTKDNGW